MAKKPKITVIEETSTGLNTRFNVRGFGAKTRGQLAKEVDAGLHEGYHTRTISGGRKIIASNPNGTESDNLG